MRKAKAFSTKALDYVRHNCTVIAEPVVTFFTIIESCKKVELDAFDYMKYIIGENHNGRTPLSPLKYARNLRGLVSGKML